MQEYYFFLLPRPICNMWNPLRSYLLYGETALAVSSQYYNSADFSDEPDFNILYQFNTAK